MTAIALPSPLPPPAVEVPTHLDLSPVHTRQSVGSMYRASPPHSREQIARWQAQIDLQVPRHDHLSWLYLRWEDGDIWQPIQRYVLWEMTPDEAEIAPGKKVPCVDPFIRADLEGPHPRSTGFYDNRPGKTEWKGGPCKSGWVDRATWEVYHETKRLYGHGQYGRRYWAIQGAAGGHPLTVPFAVQMVNRIRRPNSPDATLPAVGDLPYCEPGERIWARVGGYDKYRQWRMMADWGFRNMKHLDAEQRDQAELAAAQLTEWWDAQVLEVVQEYSSQLANIGWDAKGTSGGKERPDVDQDEVTSQQLADLFVSRGNG